MWKSKAIKKPISEVFKTTFRYNFQSQRWRLVDLEEKGMVFYRNHMALFVIPEHIPPPENKKCSLLVLTGVRIHDSIYFI